MSNDVKWLCIAFSVFVVSVFAAGIHEDHSKSNCRAELAKYRKTADEIVKVCK